VSVLSFASRRVRTTWRLPGGGGPDMGGVSADGRVLWLSGRYHAEVYAIDTRSGRLLARVRVGRGPHGLCVYPSRDATRSARPGCSDDRHRPGGPRSPAPGWALPDTTAPAAALAASLLGLILVGR
jgi:hypothetical protein